MTPAACRPGWPKRRGRRQRWLWRRSPATTWVITSLAGKAGLGSLFTGSLQACMQASTLGATQICAFSSAAVCAAKAASAGQ